MPCYSPLRAYRSKFVNVSGKRSLCFNVRDALQPDDPLDIPCGQCIGCRLKYSSHWAVRCFHESQMHEFNSFLTLTFNDEHLPDSISVRDCQLFVKRLRKELAPLKVRVAYCGEYGEKLRRPHYHFLLFGFCFPDRYLWKVTNGQRLYRSPTLERLWPFGNSLIGSVTFESAAYVARYMVKKQKGPGSELKYLDLDLETGEILRERSKEFFHTSRRPGIGSSWLEKFVSDVFPRDFCVVDGRKVSPPKFYDSKFEVLDPYLMDDVKSKRIVDSRKPKVLANNSPRRLRDREKVKLAKLKALRRGFEDGSEDV